MPSGRKTFFVQLYLPTATNTRRFTSERKAYDYVSHLAEQYKNNFDALRTTTIYVSVRYGHKDQPVLPYEYVELRDLAR